MCVLGTDPELFVRGGDGALLPAYTFLPSKSRAAMYTNGVKPFWDGFQAEFTTPGYQCLAFLVDSVQSGLKVIREKARDVDSEAQLSLDNTVEIPEAIRRLAKDQHIELGCDASLNVYGMRGDLVGNAREMPWRSAGGHMHFSLEGHERRYVEEAVRTLDAVLGVWAVGAARSIDTPIRRRYYGLAGEFRMPSHGLEYRPLSNFWLGHPAIAHLVFDIGRVALKLGLSQRRRSWAASDREVVEVINNCDVVGAEVILRRNAGFFHRLLWPVYESDGAANAALEVGLRGIEAAILDPRAIDHNWRLDSFWGAHSDSENCNWRNVWNKMVVGVKV